jgi:hypothetical protein
VTSTGEASLFDSGEVAGRTSSRGGSVEQRLDKFAEAAKSSTQLASKIRTALNSLSESAKHGNLSSAHSQILRVSESVTELASALAKLEQQEESIGLRGEEASVGAYVEELTAALAKRKVEVRRGQEPYWLAYPGWFKVELNNKRGIDLVVNGDKVDALRPSIAAEIIHARVTEQFQPKQFDTQLREVRQLLRRVGAPAETVALEDIYELLAMEPQKRTARRKDFSRAAFYYSVHRLSESLDGGGPQSGMYFPPSNRSDVLFFTRDGDSRKYLTIEFTDGRSR